MEIINKSVRPEKPWLGAKVNEHADALHTPIFKVEVAFKSPLSHKISFKDGEQHTKRGAAEETRVITTSYK